MASCKLKHVVQYKVKPDFYRIFLDWITLVFVHIQKIRKKLCGLLFICFN